jgi:hypothetical protein
VQLLDQLPFPAGGQLEAALVVVGGPVRPADGVVDVGTGVFTVTSGVDIVKLFLSRHAPDMKAL